MRAFIVFFLSYVSSLFILVSMFHQLNSASTPLIVASLAIAGLALSILAACFPWVRRARRPFLAASLCSALTVMFPMVVVSYGFALPAFLPLLGLWMAANWAGIRGMEKIAARP